MLLIERLIQLAFGASGNSVLNPDSEAPRLTKPPDPARLGELLVALMVASAASSADGVDYGAVAESDAYRAYRIFVAQLRALDPNHLGSREQRLAFWINLYNGLVVDAVVQWRVTRSVRSHPAFFWRAAYDIGNMRYSANDIENGILRANSPHPAIPRAPFRAGDPRRAISMPSVDPRIHFALVCASRACPPVAVYDAWRIDSQLDLAATAFIRGGGANVDADRGRIWLSRIFQWYAVDFGARWQALGDKLPLLRFIAAYLPPREAHIVVARPQWEVRFTDYDWSLNGRWPGTEAHSAGRS